MVQPPPWKYTSAGSTSVFGHRAGRYARTGPPPGVSSSRDLRDSGACFGVSAPRVRA